MAEGSSTPSHIRAYVRDLLENRFIRLTPLELEKAIRLKFPLTSRPMAKTAIRDLVSTGFLIYAQQHSITYLTLAPSCNIQSSRIILLSCHQSSPLPMDGVPLFLKDGVSFGAGEHPTTRLCLEGLEFALRFLESHMPINTIRALDLGTGSGVLAIAMALLGVHQVIAVDIDPLACHEAKSNVVLNRVQKRVRVVAGSEECLGQFNFHILTINLRTPTLARLLISMTAKLPCGAMILLSGFRPDEKRGLQTACGRSAWREARYMKDRGWAFMALERVAFAIQHERE